MDAYYQDKGKDIEEIPAPPEVPSFLPLEQYDSCNKVYFDLETTSFALECDIIQIGAFYHQDKSFNTYIKPKTKLSCQVEKVNGIQYDEETCEMRHNGGTVQYASNLESALLAFIEWLKSLKPVVLVAHNCKVFDSDRIVRAVDKCGHMENFKEAVAGFCDSLPFFRQHYKLPNYKQPTIVHELTGVEYDAHSAINNAKTLSQVCNISEYKDDLKRFSFSVADVYANIRFLRNAKKNLPSLRPLIHNNVLSKGMADKIAKSDLKLHHIRLAYERQGAAGVTTLLSERDSRGKARVTKSKIVRNKIINYLNCN